MHQCGCISSTYGIHAVMDFFEDDQTSDQGPPDNIHIIPPAQQTWEVGTTVECGCYLMAITGW